MSAAERPAVRLLRQADLAPVGKMLARAFLPDPTSAWLFPNQARRIAELERWYELNAALLLISGEGWVADDLSAAALWLPLGPVAERPERHGDAWRVVRLNLRGARYLGGRLPRAAITTVRLHRLHAREPVWYLAILGTEPARQGSGLGTAVLGPGLARCDRTGTPAALDTATIEDVHFYQRRGFEVVGEVQGSGGLHFWAMRRSPVQG
ncbi:MAG: GNAT family N-acetyltransferase [Candidatus Dormibacteria bacterium]